MAKSIKQSEMAKGIKKEYLLNHLDKVHELITDWLPQINAPDPLLPDDDNWGWLSVYRPTLEGDPDSKHTLKQHLRSRKLWWHHTEWERKLDAAWDLLCQLRERAASVYSQSLNSQQMGYKENYVGVALSAAFSSIYTGKLLRIQCQIPVDQHGVACGDFKIDLEATSDEERLSIQEGHTDYAYTIARFKEMKQLSVLWHDVDVLQNQMQAIAGKILKSKDVLYPCKFCRHLWK